MKDPKYKNTIFDEEGEAIVRQQLLESYYEGTTDTHSRNDANEQETK